MSSLVSVVMSVYNTPEEFLRVAVSSILNQTYRDFEFIIVNDCSNEKTTAILREYETLDSRIRLIENEVNLGLPRSLNRAIKEAKGKYVARMDSDDWSLPTRFERQVAFLEKFHDVSVLGSDFLFLVNGALRTPRRRDSMPWQIQGRLFFGCERILHPSVMIRAEVFTRDGMFYDEDYNLAEDFELWTRVCLCRKIYVLPEELVHYRISDVQVSNAQKERMAEVTQRVLLKELGYLGIEPNEDEKSVHLQFVRGKQVGSVRSLNVWVERILAANRERNLYDLISFEYYVRKHQFDSALHSITHGGVTINNLRGALVAMGLALKAIRRFRIESAKRGNPYVF